MTMLTFLAAWLALSVLTVAALAAVARLQRGGAMPPEPVAVPTTHHLKELRHAA